VYDQDRLAKEQLKFGLTLMHVPMGIEFIDDQNFKNVLAFYNKHLGVTFRPENEYDKKNYGRGYGVFK
jgi:hypothetical protein